MWLPYQAPHAGLGSNLAVAPSLPMHLECLQGRPQGERKHLTVCTERTEGMHRAPWAPHTMGATWVRM